MKYNVCILDDDLDLAENLKEFLCASDYDVKGVFSTPEECLEFLKLNPADLLIVDINLGGKVDGTQVVKRLKELYPFVKVIYTTGYSDLEILDLVKETQYDAFLSKPFRFKSLLSTIYLVLNKTDKNDGKGKMIKIRFKGRIIPFDQDSILYIESSGLYSVIHSVNQKYVVRGLLKEIYSELNQENFFRVHKSYVINLKEVTSISSRECLVKGVRIPLRRGVFRTLLEMIG
jgi:two-component system response regulator LytT